MTDQEKKQSKELLNDMKNSMGTVFRKGSDLYRELIHAFEQFLEAGEKVINPKNTYQYVSRADRLDSLVNRYEEKNRGAVTAGGRDRLEYASQIKSLLGDNRYDELRNPDVAKKFSGRTFHSLQNGELRAELHPVTVQNPELNVPVMLDHSGEKRWFTPVSQGGNKNVAAARIGALLGIQDVSGRDGKAVMYFDNKIVEGSLQIAKNGQYIQEISRKNELNYGEGTFQKAVSDLTLMRFLTGADPNASDSLIIKSELSDDPSTSKAPAKINLTGVQESSHVSGFDPARKGMDASEVRTLSKSAAANLLVLTPDIVEFTLKDVLSKPQIDQVNKNISQLKDRMVNIPLVDDGKWGEKEQKLNAMSPVYTGILRSLGPERRVSVSSETGSERSESSLQEKNNDVLKKIQEDFERKEVKAEIPPAPPLPVSKEIAKGIDVAPKKEGGILKPQKPPMAQPPAEKDNLMMELEEKLKKIGRSEERNSELKEEVTGKTGEKQISDGLNKKKVTFKELEASENPRIRIRTQEARKKEEMKKKTPGIRL